MQALADASGEELEKVRQAALVFLYQTCSSYSTPRTRGLLPVNDGRYDDYGLRKRVRDDISRRMDEKDTFSSVAGNYYNRLIELFRMIDKGDASIGLPPYNGGLFASDAAAVAGKGPASRLEGRADHLRPQPLAFRTPRRSRDQRPALRPALRKLPRHVRPAARLHLRAAT